MKSFVLAALLLAVDVSAYAAEGQMQVSATVAPSCAASSAQKQVTCTQADEPQIQRERASIPHQTVTITITY